jgi:hypothetical protein
MWTKRAASPGIQKQFTEANLNLSFNAFIRPGKLKFVCVRACVRACVRVVRAQGKGNEITRDFLSGLNIRLAKKYSADTQHTACT